MLEFLSWNKLAMHGVTQTEAIYVLISGKYICDNKM